MHSMDQQVLERVKDWLLTQQRTWLCTVVATYGSSPRPVGSLFACNKAGITVGSLSGGCVEDELVAALRSGDPALDGVQILEYGVSAEQNERLGLPCGGRLEIMLEPLDQSAAPHIEQLLHAIAARQYIERGVRLRDGERSLQAVPHYAPLERDEHSLQQVFGPRHRMLLIGAGALALTLAELAQAMDYQVLVCDPRPEVLQQWQGVDVPLLSSMPDDAVREHATDADSIVLTLTHDPRIDDMALMEALQHELFYVGALGSERTTAARRKRLLLLDIDEARLQRLHAPVGLPIGSKTPMEIAIAILAEITQLRSQRRLAALGLNP